MASLEKKPAYEDNDLMQFGKHRNLRLQDVPSSYLLYLWNDGYSGDIRLVNYIYNNLDSLMQDCPDVIPSPRPFYPIHI